jgi:integrase
LRNGRTAPAKTTGPVTLPHWLADLYSSHDFNRAQTTVYTGIARAGRKAKLTINPHMLRHIYASTLVRNGAPPNVLMRQLRHTKVEVSLRYYVQTSQEDIEGFVSTLGDVSQLGVQS